MSIEMNSIQPQESEDLYDSKIAAHFAEIRLLRERRNADCSKPRKLPAEMLATIFDILDCTFNTEGRLYPHLRWMAVTHVCRTWRNIALNEPTLWIDFTSVHPNWVQENFARSKGAPLILWPGHFHSPVDFIFDHIVEHPERIKELYFSPKFGPLARLFVKPTPYLESLSTSEDVEFPPDFLGGVAPRLRNVNSSGNLPLEAIWLSNLTRLECRRVHLEATYLSNLTSLHLGQRWNALDATSGGIRRINIDILLSALENIPLLQRLFFAIPDRMDEAPCRRSTPVHLPHLRDITADFDNNSNIAIIFNYLRVDSIQKLQTWWPTHVEPANVDPVCHFFEACYHGGNLRHLLQNGEELEMCRVVDTRSDTPILAFRGYLPTDLTRFMNLLPSCMPHVFENHTSYEPIQALALTEYDSIEELRISTRFVLPDLFKLDDASPLPYPSLRRLHFENVSFARARDGIPQLKRWLTGRKQKVELVLKDCGLSQIDIESLQETALVCLL